MKRTLFIFLLATILLTVAGPSVVAAPSWWPLVPCGLNQVPDQTTTLAPSYYQPCNRCELLHLVKNLIDFVIFGLMPILATLFIVFAGFKIMTEGAVPGQISEGRRMIRQTLLGVLIISMAWLLTNTFIRSIAKDNVAQQWWKYQCKAPTPTPLPSGTVPVSQQKCSQQFAVAPASGCAQVNQCVDVSNLTPTHGCQSNGGTCLVSDDTADRLQNVVSYFNTLTNGQCSLSIESALQVNGGPSVSQCHKPGNAKSGTCVDLHVIPYTETCAGALYTAVQLSGDVASMLDEYVSACKAGSTTGGNVHLNF